MYPHHHYWHRGPSRLIWFGIGAFAATWWAKRHNERLNDGTYSEWQWRWNDARRQIREDAARAPPDAQHQPQQQQPGFFAPPASVPAPEPYYPFGRPAFVQPPLREQQMNAAQQAPPVAQAAQPKPEVIAPVPPPAPAPPMIPLEERVNAIMSSFDHLSDAAFDRIIEAANALKDARTTARTPATPAFPTNPVGMSSNGSAPTASQDRLV